MSRVAKILLIAAGVLVLVLVYGVVVEPRLVDEQQITATVPELPSEWEGEQVAFVSDLQLGVGMTYIPLRLNCLPALTYVTLRRG